LLGYNVLAVGVLELKVESESAGVIKARVIVAEISFTVWEEVAGALDLEPLAAEAESIAMDMMISTRVTIFMMLMYQLLGQ
jgi:hypothetical protein